MTLDDVTRDREPQPRAAPVGPRTVGGVEALEDARPLLGHDPRPLVDHVDAHMTPLRPGAETDKATFRRVLQGVVDQVGEHLQHPLTISVRRRCLRLDLRADVHGEPLRDRADTADRLFQQVGHRNGLAIELLDVGLDAREAQQPVDHAAETLDL